MHACSVCWIGASQIALGFDLPRFGISNDAEDLEDFCPERDDVGPNSARLRDCADMQKVGRSLRVHQVSQLQTLLSAGSRSSSRLASGSCCSTSYSSSAASLQANQQYDYRCVRIGCKVPLPLCSLTRYICVLNQALLQTVALASSFGRHNWLHRHSQSRRGRYNTPRGKGMQFAINSPARPYPLSYSAANPLFAPHSC